MICLGRRIKLRRCIALFFFHQEMYSLIYDWILLFQYCNASCLCLFSLGKNQDRTIWSENKIRWRNYCKVRFPCFLSVSSFRVSLIFLFCICLLERDEMREAQASKFLENMVIIWPPMERLLVFIFSSPQQDTSPGTHTAAFLVSFSGASSVYLLPCI